MNEIFLLSPIVLDEVGWVSEGLKVICRLSKNSQQFQTKFCEVDLEILPHIEMAYLHYEIHLKNKCKVKYSLFVLFSSQTLSLKNLFSLSPTKQEQTRVEKFHPLTNGPSTTIPSPMKIGKVYVVHVITSKST